MANESIDKEEELDKLCPSCRTEVTSIRKCHKCGRVLSHDGGNTIDTFANPNFNESEYIDKLYDSEPVRRVEEDG